MKILSTIKGITDVWNPNQGLSDLKTADFTNLYFDMEAVCPGEDMEKLARGSLQKGARTRVVEHPEELRSTVAPFFGKLQEKNMEVLLAKAPSLLWNTKQASFNDALRILTVESIRCCGEFGVPKLIVPPLFAGLDASELFEKNKHFYTSLIPLAKEHHVMLLLENQCRDKNGHLIRGLFSNGQEAAEFLDELNETAGEEIFGYAYNGGNANLCSQNIYEEMSTLGHRIKAVLISDNNGNDKARLLPFTSTGPKGVDTDWLSLVRGVRAIDFDGDVVLEYGDTALATSPILKPALLNYAKKIGDYFLWQFEMDAMVRNYGDRVLFGAGNMCRNYMKNYGEAYPPLFTCDNNSSNWGKTFEGLEVKNPEELKKLPRDTAIFICNVYYREIEAQLKDMGLKNPIVFFNDEYLEMLHFERLEMSVMGETK